jgi:class 3 adenylate cyclase/tetratricopeptide (TPR) repeat protein
MNELVCPTCGEANPAGSRLCGMCRTALVADDPPDDRGKLVTVVTSDLKGSTALGEQLDPESLREVLNRYFAVMRVVFESHGGSIEKIIGDAIVAVFGLPFRHDDDPIRAIEAAAESQRALLTLNDELDKLWGVRLVVRTGVATGIVHFGRDAEGQHVLIGATIDESTAMEQNAPATEVLVAESTYREVRDLVETEDMGLKSPKGSDVQIQSYRLVSVVSRAEAEETVAPEPSPGMRICQVCGEESPEDYRYCVTCGAAKATALVRDSRKTVTIVFANPKPHTDTGEPLDPNAFTDVMTRYFEAMKAALERHGGTVEKFIGDAVMAVFGLPVRHEDDALRAVRAAADMQAALPALNEAFGEQYGVRLLNHIGVNTGEVIATGDASTGQRLVTGDTVNTAARLEQAAGAAEIILGELTHRLTRDALEVEVVPPLVLKGKAEPVPAYRLIAVRERPVERAGLSTQFVGRDVEVARLSKALFDAAGYRRARLINVVGDAGVGKSRLIREFAMAAAHESGLVRGRCLPYGDGITFWPLAEVVRDAASIEAEDDPATAIAKIRDLLPDSTEATEREAVTDRVASMMNLSGTEYPVAELMWGMRSLLEALAAERPLVVILDDIHSAEQTFLDVIDNLLETVEGAAILVVTSARHELFERHEAWSTAHAEETITLVPLTEGEVGQLVGELLGDLDPSVRERIATAAEGNPLYTEQIVSMLQETGAIRQEEGRWVSTRASEELAIPPTVQALVAARLDALGADERAVIEPASVIGLSFAEEAITELVDDEVRPRLETDLGSLTAKLLIRRATTDEATYRFGHLVIRDTAYASQLKRVRAALHERFVVWAERVNKERGRETEFEEILGYHLEQAYRYRTELGVIDDDDRAVGERAAVKLASAGRRALVRGDTRAASNLLRRSVDMLPRAAEFRIELMIDLGEALLQQGAFDAAASVVDDASAIAREIDHDGYVARASLIRVSVDGFRGGGGGPTHAIETARTAITVLERRRDDAGLARAWRMIMNAEASQGHLDAASTASERVLEYARAADDSRSASRSALMIGFVLLHGSTPVREAIPRCEELLAIVEGDRLVEAVGLSTLAVLRAMTGDFEQARLLYQRGRTMLLELGGGIDTHSTSIDSSHVELLAGDVEAADRELQRDYDALLAIGETYYRSTLAAYLANVRWLRGDLDGALRFADTAEEIADDDDVETHVPAQATRARVLAARGDREVARQLVTEAVRLATETASPILLADTLVALSDVLESIGDHEGSGPPLREALTLYEQKGDEVSAQRLRAREGVFAQG